MSNSKVPVVDDSGEVVVEPSAIQKKSIAIAAQYQIASFRGRPMLMVEEPYPHFVPLNRDRFDRIGYSLLGGITRGQMGDVFAYLSNAAEDLTGNDHLILFGQRSDEIGEDARATVWDMQMVGATGYEPDKTIWRSPYPQGKTDENTRLPFVMQLAGNDEGLYDDIMQSIAPMIMEQKPDGVVWWVGDGANGKSTLMDAIYKIFPGQLSSITVKRLTDGRDTPSLNGTLANVVKESSEGRIDDTEIYKSIGTHENFRVHKFHSQDDIEIRGNLHHIFSGNSIPAFNDKGYSARRRTFVIPFNQRFESNPNFEAKTFTPEFFAQLIGEMCRYAKKLKAQGYRYKWSAATLAAKLEYDSEANSAEEYAKAIIAEGVVGFDSFNPVRNDYEQWCADSGVVPLGIGNLRRAMQSLGFERLSIRDGGNVSKQYRLPNFEGKDLEQMGMGRPGLYTVSGFQAPTEKPAASDTIPDSMLDPWA